jgi:hypothetical protein
VERRHNPGLVPVEEQSWLGRAASMAIYRIFQNNRLEPEQIARLSEAYEQTLRTLSLVDRNDPLTEMIAKKIIEIGQTGVKEPVQISELAIKDLGIASPI